VAAIIGPAEVGKEVPGQAEGKDHFAGDGAEVHTVACAMAPEQKGRLAVEERNLNHRQRKHLRLRRPSQGLALFRSEE